MQTIAVRLTVEIINISVRVLLIINRLNHGDFQNHHDLENRKYLIINNIIS